MKMLQTVFPAVLPICVSVQASSNQISSTSALWSPLRSLQLDLSPQWLSQAFFQAHVVSSLRILTAIRVELFVFRLPTGLRIAVFVLPKRLQFSTAILVPLTPSTNYILTLIVQSMYHLHFSTALSLHRGFEESVCFKSPMQEVQLFPFQGSVGFASSFLRQMRVRFSSLGFWFRRISISPLESLVELCWTRKSLRRNDRLSALSYWSRNLW